MAPVVTPAPVGLWLELGLLLPVRDARVDAAIEVPSPGCRRQTLGLGLIHAVAGVPELPAHDEPGIVVRGCGTDARHRAGAYPPQRQQCQLHSAPWTVS